MFEITDLLEIGARRLVEQTVERVRKGKGPRPTPTFPRLFARRVRSGGPAKG